MLKTVKAPFDNNIKQKIIIFDLGNKLKDKLRHAMGCHLMHIN